MLMREARGIKEAGRLDEAEDLLVQAAAVFNAQAKRGVEPALAQLEEATAEAGECRELRRRQEEARLEARRLAAEARSFLTNGDLETALILADRAQGALDDVEQNFGRVSAEELSEVLQVRVRAEEKTLMRREMAAAAAAAAAEAAADAAASERRGEAVAATEKRAALERRRKEKLADRKRADAQAARAQKAQAPPAAADEETWRVDRNLAAQADRGARLALRAGQLEEAKELALQAVALFESAGKQGFRKAPPSCPSPPPLRPAPAETATL